MANPLTFDDVAAEAFATLRHARRLIRAGGDEAAQRATALVAAAHTLVALAAEVRDSAR